MKKTLRFTSAALTLALAAGMALPAFAAAKPSFSKDETVYAVMAPDGSVTSTTVSAHLYNAAGLSGVTDRSTLTDIVNTESDAAFTQNGDSLTWDTTDTDVYYKGNTSRALPVSAAVTYTLDGETAPLENLLGKSGHLTIRIDLTNNETGTVTVNGAERTVVTPFITAVGVVLGEDASNVTLEHGLLESAAKSTVAAFVTLPGVRGALSGLLPDSFSAAEDYLQDSVTVEADVENLSAPQILLASAASAEALGQDNVFDLSSIDSLTDGISHAAAAERCFPAGGRRGPAGQWRGGTAGWGQPAEQWSGPADRGPGYPDFQQHGPDRRCPAGGRRGSGFRQQDPDGGRPHRHAPHLGQLRRCH